MIAPSPALFAGISIAGWLGSWSRPPDRPAQAALALGVALLSLAVVPHGPRWLASVIDLSSVADLRRRRRFLMVASLAAAFLSLGYIAFYLRGGPRTPEASTYWLQGRALSHGALAWNIPEPLASFRSRDLVFVAPDRLSGAVPPGYPALLALAFLVGAPMLVGPVLAAAVVVATWLLAHEVAADTEGIAPAERTARAETVARVAAGFSIVSAALRYHTANVLPYGAAAAAMTLSLACALRARRTEDVRLFGAAGFGVGFLIASQPASAIAVGVIVAVLAMGALRRNARVKSKPVGAIAFAWTFAGLLPGALLLLLANHTTTGNALLSPIEPRVGPNGATSVPASLVLSTMQSASAHLMDVANLEPLALLALVPLCAGRRRRAVALTALVIAGHVAVQMVRWSDAAPFGASPLVALVPLEHVLMALGIARLFPRTLISTSVAAMGLALAGFAVHASHAHEALSASDLGRPRFEPDVLREANVSHGLLFFEDDSGYELAHDPGVTASHGIEAARMLGDDHDRLLYDSLGHPPVHRYIAAAAGASVAGWASQNAGSETWHFEAESDWPPVAQVGGWSDVVSGADACVSEGRVVRLTPGASNDASAMLALPVPRGTAPGERRWMVAPRIFQQGLGGDGVLALVTHPVGTLPSLTSLAQRSRDKPLAEWSWSDSGNQAACIDLPPQTVALGEPRTRAWLVVRAHGGPVMLDKTTIWPN